MTFKELKKRISFLDGSTLDDQIDLGSSGDTKFLFNKEDKKYLLRVQSSNKKDRSIRGMTIGDKLEMIVDVMKRSKEEGAFVPYVFDYGKIDDDLVYIITDFLSGQSLYDSAKDIPNLNQYEIGKELGLTLKNIHKASQGVKRDDWKEFVLSPVYGRVEAYRKMKHTLPLLMDEEMESRLLEYINEHKQLLEDVQFSIIHNDVHDGNVVQDLGVFMGLIDFTEVMVGDVLYDHKYLNHSTVYEYPYFAAGVLHGYFGEVTEDVWRRSYLYIAVNILKYNPLPHLDYFTLEEATEELRVNEVMFKELHKMEQFPPKWYEGLDFLNFD